MLATSTDNLFLTDDQIASAHRRGLKAQSHAKVGHPIRAAGKVLCMIHTTGGIYAGTATGLVDCIKVNKAKQMQKVSSFRAHTAPVSAMALGVFKNQMVVLTGSWDQSIACWSMGGELVFRWPKVHSDHVTSLVATQSHVVSGCADGSIKVWSLSTGQCELVIKSHTRRVESIVMMDEEHFISVSSDRQVLKHHLTGKLVQSYPEHATSVYSICIDHDREEIWTASADKSVRRVSFKGTVELAIDHPDWVRALALSEHYVVSAGRDEVIRVYDRCDGGLKGTFDGHWDEVSVLTFADHDRLLSASYDGTIRVWSLRELTSPPETTASEPVKSKLLTAEEEQELADLMS
jgi:WD40 repeat protein